MRMCPVCLRDGASLFCGFCGGTEFVDAFEECERCGGLPGWLDDDGEPCPLCNCVGFVHGGVGRYPAEAFDTYE